MRSPIVKSLFTGLFALAVLMWTASSGRADDAHRFRAIYNSTFALTPDPGLPANVLAKVITGKGFNTLLGESTVHFDGTIDLSAAPFPIAGVTTMKGADGDELHFKTTGKVNPAAYDAALVRLDYEFAVTGGTGKFRRASGHALVFGCAVFQTASSGTASWSMEGRLRFRKARSSGND